MKEAEFLTWLKKAEEAVNKYGLRDSVTHPYPNTPMTAAEIIRYLKDYDQCTPGSKAYLLALAEGFKKILDAWVAQEKQPKRWFINPDSGNEVVVTHDVGMILKQIGWKEI